MGVTGIYSILNLKNNKQYIGQSHNIIKRFYKHKSELRNNEHHSNHLQNSWNKYGEKNFKFNIITLCEKESLDELESYYITLYNTRNPDFGYNIESGGNKNKTVDLRTRKKISKSLSSRRHPFYGKFKEQAPFYGYKHSEITKKKISQANKGSNNPNYGKKYSLKEKLKLSLKNNNTNYYKVGKNKNKRYKQGFIWSYTYKDQNNKRKKICSVDINKLEKKVKSKGLLWCDLSKLKLQEDLSSKSNFNQQNKVKDYAYIIPLNLNKRGNQKYGLLFKNEIIKKSTFPERLQIICAQINYSLNIPLDLFKQPKKQINNKKEAHLIKLGKNSAGNKRYGVSFKGKLLESSTSKDKLNKICDKINNEGIESYLSEKKYKETHAYIRKEKSKNRENKDVYSIIYHKKIIKRSIYKEKLEEYCNEINSKGIKYFKAKEQKLKGKARIIKDGIDKQGTQKYSIIQNGKTIKTSIYREPLIDLCNEINKEFKEIN